jgi:Flp pilus assembly secretin CpaC
MTRILSLFVVCAALVAGPVLAEDVVPTPAPVQPGMVLPTTGITPGMVMTLDGELPLGAYPILRLTPDKIEVVKLDKDATNVIVGNSKHVVAVMETSRQILLVPRQPGATHLQVMDAKGNTIMERSIIVASPKQDYVRVRRSCKNDTSGNCKEFSIFYCPDMCHNVHVTQEQQGNAAAAPATPNETAGNGGAGAEQMNDGAPVTQGPSAPPIVP